MAQLKTGTRLKSAVCATEVMVIAAPADEIAVTCGGAPMLLPGEEAANGASLDAAASEGTQLGKRYVNDDHTLELLCVKPGDGSLAANGASLGLKEAKPLPSSD